MQVGTALFLSALIISALTLYLFTKDSWQWGRIVRWGLGLSFIAVTTSATIIFFPSGILPYRSVSAQPEFWGLKIGMSIADVLVLKGAPNRKFRIEAGHDKWLYRLEDQSSSSEYRVEFKSGRVKTVSVASNDAKITLDGVYIGEGFEEAIKRLGSPDAQSTSEDQLRRIYVFKSLRAAVGIEAGKVAFLGLYDGQGRWNFSGKNV